jgi:hypothetical protein
MALKVVNSAERPELVEQADRIDGGFHEYNYQGEVLRRLWTSLFDRFPTCQLALYDDSSSEVLGAGNTIPCYWDGSTAGLPSGIDEVFERGFAEDLETANALSALLIKIIPTSTGKGLSRLLIAGMCDIARKMGFDSLIAPVRPTLKHCYPITPIEEYVLWTREDGLPFDPWIRVHHRLGADLLGVAPNSLRIAGTVAEWELWTKMRFPANGLYVFPGGLAPVRVDHEADEGLYYEPNVWMRHRSKRLSQ